MVLYYQRYQRQYTRHIALSTMQAAYDGNFSALIAVFHTETVLQDPQSVNSVIFLNILQQAFSERMVVEAKGVHRCIWYNLYGYITDKQ